MPVLDQKLGDVNGDRILDLVYLTGDSQADSPFYENITLHIRDGRTGRISTIPLKQNSGYNPTIQLADYTGDGASDILIVIDSGGSGGFIYAYVFSYLNNQPRLLFDYELYNQAHAYSINYEDGYKVRATSATPASTYIIDLTYKGEAYLSEIYTPDGKLKEPIQGDVNPLGGLYPVDFDRDGRYELMALQRITGRYNADGLGYFMNELNWNGSHFYPSQQWVWITGSDTGTSNA
ncbi:MULTISPECIES: FG-GAP-like repeat-containing protein [Paenibacillus]|uniref:Spore coat protein n=1 Tax=Paenibacillus campinasensis TaxID=66347 RepID=A0A268ETL1_9BACL|nr:MULTISPECIES: FG-GAP-like repeat-containing protein [Paenibacillus]MUG67104.1 VCBS repeat-containing protein [Paenibacillus campinasensis]PAD76467.1 spore coat protein [Paenibacillus campinasensis]PAK55008.1 spore coat protein [Paenibacillus sp. 7541]